MNPTKEQWFWEQCGFEYDDESIQTITYPDGHVTCWPLALDFNNLWEYAVPKLIKKLGKTKVLNLLTYWVEMVMIYDKDPADYLFELIYKALGGKE